MADISSPLNSQIVESEIGDAKADDYLHRFLFKDDKLSGALPTFFQF
jgi:hypothetical protein